MGTTGLNNALIGLKVVFVVANDTIVYGSGTTFEDAEKDHEINLLKLREKCKEQHLNLNNDKAVVKTSEIKFMGHLISSKGVEADPSKIEAIVKIPSPTDVSSVKRFYGMVQYLARFLPNLANDLKPIRKLTRKGEERNWSAECEAAIQKVNEIISAAPILQFNDSKQELILQVDGSKDGTGAVLM